MAGAKAQIMGSRRSTINRLSNVIIDDELNVSYHNRNPSIAEMASTKISAIGIIEDISSRMKSPFWDNENVFEIH